MKYLFLALLLSAQAFADSEHFDALLTEQAVHHAATLRSAYEIGFVEGAQEGEQSAGIDPVASCPVSVEWPPWVRFSEREPTAFPIAVWRANSRSFYLVDADSYERIRDTSTGRGWTLWALPPGEDSGAWRSYQDDPPAGGLLRKLPYYMWVVKSSGDLGVIGVYNMAADFDLYAELSPTRLE